MNAKLIEKATTLKTTKGESQNAFKRINQAKVSAIRLTHTGREVPPSGLKPGEGVRGGAKRLDLLKIAPDSQVELTTDGQSIRIAPVNSDDSKAKIRAA